MSPKPTQSGPRPVPGPISLPPPNMRNLTTTGGLISPESETHSSTITNPAQEGSGRLIDPTKVSYFDCVVNRIEQMQMLISALQPLHKREFIRVLCYWTSS